MLAGGLVLSRGASTSVDELGRLALGLAIIVTAALVGGHFAVSIGQPAVLGELLAGIVLGNAPGLAGLQFIGADSYLDILSRVGMLLLLFEVGLELSVRDLFAVGRSSFAVAVTGTASSLAIGMGTAAVLTPDMSMVNHLFLGAAITATSVGITARVLKDMGASRSAEAKIILGAAVVDDISASVSSCHGRQAPSAWRRSLAPLLRVLCSRTPIRTCLFSGANVRSGSCFSR